MLSINTIKSGVRKKEAYYTEDESLKSKSKDEAQAKYYSEAETQSETERLTQAVWHGKGAKKYGLVGQVKQEDFKSLFYGFKPGTTERIRAEKPNSQNRERLAEDFTWSPPKSVSMAMHLNRDWRLFDAQMDAVKECLDLLETRYATTRIQVKGDRQVVSTDNLIIALIPHHISRAGDMQMHIHAVIMNGTQGSDGVWRSLQNDRMSLQKWLGALYRQKLAHKVQALGYEIEPARNGFEIKGVTQADIQVFSKRSQEIVRHLKQSGLDLTPENRDRATLTTRGAKPLSQTLEKFHQGWQSKAKATGVTIPQPGKLRLSF